MFIIGTKMNENENDVSLLIYDSDLSYRYGENIFTIKWVYLDYVV